MVFSIQPPSPWKNSLLTVELISLRAKTAVRVRQLDAGCRHRVNPGYVRKVEVGSYYKLTVAEKDSICRGSYNHFN